MMTLGRFLYHALGSGRLPPHLCLPPKLEPRPRAHHTPTPIRMSSAAGQSAACPSEGATARPLGISRELAPLEGWRNGADISGLGMFEYMGAPIVHGIARRKLSSSAVGVYGIGIAPARSGIGRIRDHSRGITSTGMSGGVTSKCKLSISGEAIMAAAALDKSSSISIDGEGQAHFMSCKAATTPLWRRSPQGQPPCNACVLFFVRVVSQW